MATDEYFSNMTVKLSGVEFPDGSVETTAAILKSEVTLTSAQLLNLNSTTGVTLVPGVKGKKIVCLGAWATLKFKTTAYTSTFGAGETLVIGNQFSNLADQNAMFFIPAAIVGSFFGATQDFDVQFSNGDPSQTTLVYQMPSTDAAGAALQIATNTSGNRLTLGDGTLKVTVWYELVD